MTWNYRVIEFPDVEPYRQIHEVHYEDGKPSTYTYRPAGVSWYISEDPGDILEMMKLALDKPVLTPEDFRPNKRETVCQT